MPSDDEQPEVPSDWRKSGATAPKYKTSLCELSLRALFIHPVLSVLPVQGGLKAGDDVYHYACQTCNLKFCAVQRKGGWGGEREGVEREVKTEGARCFMK